MATYVMSDLHGRYDRYEKMLQAINFSDSDKLIIAGDVVDRGPDGIKILLDIMSRPNVEFIIGNHELLMIDAIMSLKDDPRETFGLWMYNWYSEGGQKTHAKFKRLRAKERESVLRFLLNAPYSAYKTVNGRSFYIVHGGPKHAADPEVLTYFSTDKYIIAWCRPNVNTYIPMVGVDYVIFGHTPTYYYQGVIDGHLRIFKGTGNASQLIGIDCACGSTKSYGRLACLRLDDFEEFYVD